jgi:hypothetical protein
MLTQAYAERYYVTFATSSDSARELMRESFAATDTRLSPVDELLALALVLGVAPNRLMLGTEHDSEPVWLTPNVETTANGAWRWACGEHVIRPGAHGAPPLRCPGLYGGEPAACG